MRFTDQLPLAPDITAHDPGTEHTVAAFDTPAERTVRYCYLWNSFYNSCQSYKNRYYVAHSRAGTDWTATHHAGRVSLAAVRDGDPDGDTARVEIINSNNPHLAGRSGIIGDAGAYSHWATDATEEWVYTAFSISGGRPVNTADGTRSARTPSGCVRTDTSSITTDITVYGYGSAWNTKRFYANEFSRWSAPTDTDPGCVPLIPDECDTAAMLADWSMCYALWPNTTSPAPLVVDYRACDARQEAAGSDGTAFAAYLMPLIASSLPSLTESQVAYLIRRRVAGNSTRPVWPYTYTQADWDAAVAAIDPQLHSRYCSDGTVTVLLGDSSTVSIQPAATATEGTPLGFTVTLDSPAAIDVTVTFSTEADVGGAHPAASSDYLSRTDAQVTIHAGQTQATARVFTVQDSIHEHDETLKVVIAGATGARLGANLEAVGTIANDDSPPVAGFDGDVTADEDTSILLNPPVDIDSDGIPDTEHVYGESMRFTVTLAGESDRPVTVGYDTETTPGTATSVASCQQHPGNSAEDYRHRSGTLTFMPGDTSKTITVRLCPDDQSESDETLTVTLSLPSGASLDPAGAAATGTIRDNDTPVPLPFYAPPPTAPECPTLWHEHGFDCRPDHTVPIVCGTSAHAYQLHDITDPSGHQALTHPACASAPDVCSTGFHDHAGGCVRIHEDPPLPCVANRRLVWQNTIHGTSVLLACPNPDVDAELLVNTAGRSITLSFSVDVTSGHVEPTRTFKITAVDGTAVNGTHYTMTAPVTATFDAATHTYTMLIPTIARHDHGADPRRFTVTIIDTHPLRGHMSVTVTSAINPPAIERQ